MNGDFVHRLGAAVAMVLVAEPTGARSWNRAAGPGAAQAPQGPTGTAASTPIRSAGRRAEALSTLRPWLPLAGDGGRYWALVGGAVGVLVGLVGAVALWRWSARRSAAGTEAAQVAAAQAARQLPLAADLLAACIAAGASPVAAARAVGEALGGPVGDALGRGAAEVRLGGEPAGAWRGLAAVPGAVPLARLLERAEVSGLPAAGPVARLAAQARADWARTTTVRARRAAVMVTAPVGLCFLPAFIAVGVLPVVIGLAAWGAGSRGRRWLTDRGVGRAAVEQRMSKRATESNLTGVAMYQMVRERLGALVGGVLGAVRRRAARRDAGMVTSEYAMGIVAAVAFAVVLYKVVTSGTVSAELQGIVKGALDARM